MRKPQTQDDRRVSLMARDQYVRSVKWTPCAEEGEEEHLLERLERGKVERHKACPDERACQDADAARERLVAIYQRMVSILRANILTAVARWTLRIWCKRATLDCLRPLNATGNG
jgi:hypothetical protein